MKVRWRIVFTGLVEEIGTVRSIRHGRTSAVLSVRAETILSDLKTGDSVAVNGVCLTAASVDAGGFTADVMPETIDRSSLGTLGTGSLVNLERAMSAQGRFGGHIVSGHIDGTGTITRLRRDESAVWYTVASPPEVLRYVVEKGSITIDGISLTVVKVTDIDFSVSLIPHTSAVTVLGKKKEGAVVNLEADIIGKYVEKLLNYRERSPRSATGLTMDFLTENGF